MDYSKTIETSANCRIYLAGEGKIGKTTAVNTLAPEVLFLNTGGGFSAFPQGSIHVTPFCGCWEDYKRLQKEIAADKDTTSRYKYICIDHISALVTYYSSFVCGKLGISHESDAEWGKSYDYIKKGILEELNFWNRNFGVILIDHVTPKDVKNAKGVGYTKLVPTLKGFIWEKVKGWVDTILCMELDIDDKGNQIRVIDSRPAKEHFAGTRNQKTIPPKIKPEWFAAVVKNKEDWTKNEEWRRFNGLQ